VSPAGTVIEAGRPILTVFASGEATNDVEGQLRIRARELERQLYGSEVP
jgi:predicted ATP-grasp superfamily ATP-dependent carboligase